MRFARILSLILFVIILWPVAIFSQATAVLEDPSLEFNTANFGDDFCVFVDEVGEANYFITNQAMLTGDFQRIYLLHLVYKDGKVVNIDPDIDAGYMWFKASVTYPAEEIKCLLDDMRDQTVKAEQAFTGEERELWLQKNNKFIHKR